MLCPQGLVPTCGDVPIPSQIQGPCCALKPVLAFSLLFGRSGLALALDSEWPAGGFWPMHATPEVKAPLYSGGQHSRDDLHPKVLGKGSFGVALG